MSTNLTLGADGATILAGDKVLELTGYEARILRHLVQAGEGRLCPKPELESAMHNGGVTPAASNVLEVMVSRIRKHLRAVGADVEIVTVRARGYMLRAIERAEA